ncbi:MAG: acylphosphatase [Amphritea sp.]
MYCLHLYVSGRVQGVWFRQSTKDAAEANGVCGWAKNLPDGRVEVMACGEEKGVRQLEAWLSIGPELATVAEVLSEPVQCEECFTGFEIR